MTAPDVRTAAQAEAERRTIAPNESDPLPADHHTIGWRLGFAHGAVWGAALVTPTREQIAEALCSMKFLDEQCRVELDCEESIGSHAFQVADAVLSLIERRLQAGVDV